MVAAARIARHACIKALLIKALFRLYRGCIKGVLRVHGRVPGFGSATRASAAAPVRMRWILSWRSCALRDPSRITQAISLFFWFSRAEPVKSEPGKSVFEECARATAPSLSVSLSLPLPLSLSLSLSLACMPPSFLPLFSAAAAARSACSSSRVSCRWARVLLRDASCICTAALYAFTCSIQPLLSPYYGSITALLRL